MSRRRFTDAVSVIALIDFGFPTISENDASPFTLSLWLPDDLSG